jgi:protein O-GlcNAc transferase
MTTLSTQRLNDAVHLQQAGEYDTAERICAEVLRDEPGHIDAHQLLVAGRFVRGQHVEALTALASALDFHPDNFELNVLAAHNLRAVGKLEDAAIHYARAVGAQPESAEARVMLGWSLRALDRRAEAAAQYEEAVRLNPNLVEAHNNLGVLYHDNGELEAAIACYRQVLTHEPAHVEARRNLCAALRASNRSVEALAEFETLLAFHPDHAYAALMVMQTRRELCRWQDYTAMEARVHDIATRNAGSFSPFLLFTWLVEPALLHPAARAYTARFTDPMPVSPDRAHKQGEKLRIGYLSADFRTHVVAAVVPEVLELHDRNAFDIFAYSYGPDDASPQRQRIAAASGIFRDIRAVADDGAARQIREDGIDILVDLTGLTGNIRHGILARRPAPLQILWLGYPGTSGSPAVDYLVADPFSIPPGAEQFYSEKIIRLPGSCQPHDRTRPIGTPAARALYGLPDNAFVFCSFNHVQKLNPQIFAVWMDILAAVPESVLWLRSDTEEAAANLRLEAQVRGLDANRLVFAGRSPDMADHLARYGAADLALDTFPYTSHTTANDALWCGCPLITMAGETFPSRIAGGILQALSLGELVTDSLDSYRRTAIRLARDRAALAALRGKLARSHPHFDTMRFTRHLEAGYRAAWNLRVAGLETRHIMVPA